MNGEQQAQAGFTMGVLTPLPWSTWPSHASELCRHTATPLAKINAKDGV
jgi:hypothetical protein